MADDAYTPVAGARKVRRVVLRASERKKVHDRSPPGHWAPAPKRFAKGERLASAFIAHTCAVAHGESCCRSSCRRRPLICPPSIQVRTNCFQLHWESIAVIAEHQRERNESKSTVVRVASTASSESEKPGVEQEQWRVVRRRCAASGLLVRPLFLSIPKITRCVVVPWSPSLPTVEPSSMLSCQRRHA